MFVLTEKPNDAKHPLHVAAPPVRTKGIEAVMAYMNTTTRSDVSPLRDLIAHPLQSLQLMAQRRRVYLQTLKELNALSDRDLSDLGLHRSMISAVAKDAAYGK